MPETQTKEKVDASPWVSPIVVVQKKSGGIRMCVDLREPNKAVIMDCYPLPHIDDLLSKLCGATVFSTIDLESAYFQLPLHEESRDLIAFITHEGLFRFCRVPFGHPGWMVPSLSTFCIPENVIYCVARIT